MKLILNNLEGKVNKPTFDNYEEGIMMLKYNGLLFLLFIVIMYESMDIIYGGIYDVEGRI